MPQSLRAPIGPLQGNQPLFQYVIGISGVLPHKHVSRSLEIFSLHSTFARLSNAAASPASHLCSTGSLAIIKDNFLKITKKTEIRCHGFIHFSIFFLAFPLSNKISQQNFVQNNDHLYLLLQYLLLLGICKDFDWRLPSALIMYVASKLEKWSCPLLTKA